ncbi:LysR family transcriptional regulator [Reinekea thalattae]|uniref:LysR family transcriptional regulator n=1 Tax=Reinekea thalattae TaxID=2593301 RepID=A0A5C8Z8G9_9GAMM|nr:LysR family transcriptional regulator [Reinekea thalattae]TXR54415.1 LysR family transcriptional regulator [Reinekea thalattae]
MGQLEEMAMLVRIVDTGGITRAAEQLGIAKSAVSRRLNELETRLGCQLLSRTTRKFSLTEAGEHYYQRAMNILDEIKTLDEQTSGVHSSVEGTLKLSLPLSFGLMHLSPLIDQYLVEHPQLKLQLDFSDRRVDLVEEGFELAIRIGELRDSSYQAKRLTRIRQVLCASPDYLLKQGAPQTLEELQTHQFLQYGFAKQAELKCIDEQGRHRQLRLNSSVQVNNGDFMQQLAINGHGITMLPSFLVYQSIKQGLLVPLLNEYRWPESAAYAVYPRNRFLPQRCRLLIDFIAEQLGDQPYWDR